MTLSKREVYNSSYRGVNFEICKWRSRELPEIDVPEQDKFTFYLYIRIGSIPETSNPESYWLKAERSKLSANSSREWVSYNEYDSPLGSLDWHGGITWYSKETNEDTLPEDRVIKAGCDYSHYGDEGRIYDIDYVLQEVKQCIDSFKEKVPGYKWHCGIIGGYWDASEGIVSEDGNSFTSNKGVEWIKERESGKEKESI